MSPPNHMPNPDAYSIRYEASDTTAYWLLFTPESRFPQRFCANRYATFRGWETGQNQVFGYASSPIGYRGEPDAKLLRRYFLRELRGMVDEFGLEPKFSVVRVETVSDLVEIEDAINERYAV